MSAYYNEIDPYAAQWLRNLIKAGHIADGEVDTRSIVDVQPDDIRHFTQCHFFAGIAGWSHAFRLAGWPDDRKVWTGSCPCQPFSVAGKGKGTDDERHLWPHFFRLIRGCRPPVVMGEQVAGAAGYGWLDGVRFDLESEGYAIEGVDIAACSVNAPHIRQRLYWVASDLENTTGNGCQQRRHTTGSEIQGECSKRGGELAPSRVDGELSGRAEGFHRTSLPAVCDMGDTISEGLEGRYQSEHMELQGGKEQVRPVRAASSFDSSPSSDMSDCTSKRLEGAAGKSLQRYINGSSCDGYWDNAVWLNGADGKARRAEPNICLLAHGVPARVGKLRAYGNAIVPPLAAEVIRAFMEKERE